MESIETERGLLRPACCRTMLLVFGCSLLWLRCPGRSCCVTILEAGEQTCSGVCLYSSSGSHPTPRSINTRETAMCISENAALFRLGRKFSASIPKGFSASGQTTPPCVEHVPQLAPSHFRTLARPTRALVYRGNFWRAALRKAW